MTLLTKRSVIEAGTRRPDRGRLRRLRSKRKQRVGTGPMGGRRSEIAGQLSLTCMYVFGGVRRIPDEGADMAGQWPGPSSACWPIPPRSVFQSLVPGLPEPGRRWTGQAQVWALLAAAEGLSGVRGTNLRKGRALAVSGHPSRDLPPQSTRGHNTRPGEAEVSFAELTSVGGGGWIPGKPGYQPIGGRVR